MAIKHEDGSVTLSAKELKCCATFLELSDKVMMASWDEHAYCGCLPLHCSRWAAAWPTTALAEERPST